MNILQAITDPKLFAPWFKRGTWQPWLAFLAALFALPMTPEQLAIYRQCTGRNDPPTSPITEAWLVVGRRGGKSFMLALIAVFLACFRDWRQYLTPGERGTIMIIAKDRRQARIILRYMRRMFKAIPMLKRMVERETAEGFDLDNDITIEVHTASFRSTRGYAIVCCLLDELAFWDTAEDNAEPDFEIIAALKPGMLQFGGEAMMLCASSPYARKGALWVAYQKHFGKEGDPALVWQAATRTMNPSVPQREIDAAIEEDPAKFEAEYNAIFRRDVEAFVSREIVEACVSARVFERPRVHGVTYRGFVDPAGGSGPDSMTLAIAHRADKDRAVLDVLREAKPRFSPAQVVAEFAPLLKAYGIHRVRADKWGSDWVAEPFKAHGITVETTTTKPKSDIYVQALALLNSGRVDLLDNARLITQLCGLERKTARSGKDSIDHIDGGHDDVCNAACGALTSVTNSSRYLENLLDPHGWMGDDGPVDEPKPEENEREICITMALNSYTRDQAVEHLKQRRATFKPPSLMEHPDIMFQRPRRS